MACDDDEFEVLVFGDELPLPESFNCSHQLFQEHALDCQKDEVRSFEKYCEIIAKMKSSHDPKMKIVSSMLSNVDFPPLIENKVAHDVKAYVCKAKADSCKSDGAAEDKEHVGATVGLLEGDKGHAAGSADWGPERRIDNGIDKGKAHEQVATSFALALVCDIHASGGKAGPSARH